MGFSSYTSVVSGKSIMNKYGEDHEGIALVFPNDQVIFGDYDGYARVETSDDLIDIFTLSALKGDMKKYDSLLDDSQEKERLRGEGIDGFYEGSLHLKAMTRWEYIQLKASGPVTWDSIENIFENAPGQGHWLDETSEEDFVYKPKKEKA